VTLRQSNPKVRIRSSFFFFFSTSTDLTLVSFPLPEFSWDPSNAQKFMELSAEEVAKLLDSAEKTDAGNYVRQKGWSGGALLNLAAAGHWLQADHATDLPALLETFSIGICHFPLSQTLGLIPFLYPVVVVRIENQNTGVELRLYPSFDSILFFHWVQKNLCLGLGSIGFNEVDLSSNVNVFCGPPVLLMSLPSFPSFCQPFKVIWEKFGTTWIKLTISGAEPGNVPLVFLPV